MTSPICVMTVFLALAIGSMGYPYFDPPAPLPQPNEHSQVVRAATVQEDDTVLKIEKELEQELHLPRGQQIEPKTYLSPTDALANHMVDQILGTE